MRKRPARMIRRSGVRWTVLIGTSTLITGAALAQPAPTPPGQGTPGGPNTVAAPPGFVQLQPGDPPKLQDAEKYRLSRTDRSNAHWQQSPGGNSGGQGAGGSASSSTSKALAGPSGS